MKTSNFLMGLSLLMAYGEFGFSTEYGGAIMVLVTLFGAWIYKTYEE